MYQLQEKRSLLFIALSEMKIVLISTHVQTGGAAKASWRLMKLLRKNGIDISMLVQDGENVKEGIYSTTHRMVKRWKNLARFILERLVFLRQERSKSIRFLFSLANTGESISGNQHVREADIIHLHWINGGFLSLKSLRELLELGKPVVWTFHDMWPFTGGCHYALECFEYQRQCGQCPYLKKPSEKDLSHRIWKRKEHLFRNSNVTVITPSQWLQECARSSSMIAHWDYHTIHNPIDQVLFRPVDRDDACATLDLDPAKKYILFGAATLKNVIKGFEYFQKAIEILYRDLKGDPGVEILLFGKSMGDVESMFPFRTRNIAFIQSTETLVHLYNMAHLFLIPSLQDNLPNTIVESMLCGTPVVGFNTGGIPEMIDHKVNGYLANFKAAEDLAQGMKWVLESDNYDELSSTVRDTAVKMFSMEASLEKHVELYRELLEQRKT